MSDISDTSVTKGKAPQKRRSIANENAPGRHHKRSRSGELRKSPHHPHLPVVIPLTKEPRQDVTHAVYEERNATNLTLPAELAITFV